MSIAEFIADLARRGIRLEAQGERLRYYPRSALTPDLLERLKAHKAEVLAFLQSIPDGLIIDHVAWREYCELERLPAGTREAQEACVNTRELKKHYPRWLKLILSKGQRKQEQVSQSPHPGPAPREVRLLLESLWNAGYRLKLEPSITPEQWFILPKGNPNLPAETAKQLFDLYEKHHDKARDYILTLLAAYGLTPPRLERMGGKRHRLIRSALERSAMTQ